MATSQTIVSLTLSEADDSNSPQRYMRISNQITAQIIQLQNASIAIDLPSTITQIQRYQEILQRFRISYWDLGDLVNAQTLADVQDFGDQQMARANAAENRLATMTTLAERLATLENPTTAASRPKPIEIRTLEEFTGSQSNLK